MAFVRKQDSLGCRKHSEKQIFAVALLRARQYARCASDWLHSACECVTSNPRFILLIQHLSTRNSIRSLPFCLTWRLASRSCGSKAQHCALTGDARLLFIRTINMALDIEAGGLLTDRQRQLSGQGV